METRREIQRVYYLGWNIPKDAESVWEVQYRVWGTNGKNLGTWSYTTASVDEAGAKLKTLIKWREDDARNARRRARKEQKEHNNVSTDTPTG